MGIRRRKEMRTENDSVKQLASVLAIAALVLVVTAAFVIPFMPVGRSATTWNVYAQLPQFAPTPITIQIGDTVHWHNNDSIYTHTVTSTNSSWLEMTMAPGGDAYYTFTAWGTYDYYCSIHPSMTGRVVVENPAIPEFPSLLLVVTGLLAMFLSMIVASRKR